MGQAHRPLYQHDRLPAPIALSATERRLQTDNWRERRQPQALQQRAPVDQLIMAAGETLHPKEIARAEILDVFSGPGARQQGLRYAVRKYGHFREVQSVRAVSAEKPLTG